MSYNYKLRVGEVNRMPTLQEVIRHEADWTTAHMPVDRATKLNLFAYKVIEAGSGGALVPLSQEIQTVPPVQLSQYALEQLLERLDISKKLWERLDATTRFLIVNKMFQNIQDTKLERDVLFRIQDNNMLRALMSSKYEPFDCLELLKYIEPLCGDAKITVAYNDERTMQISLIFPGTATEVKKGDIIEQGIHIRNSEIGLSSVTVAGYNYRLICSNGAIGGGDGGMYRFRHTGDSDNLRDRVKSAVEAAAMEARGITKRFQEALNIMIDDPIKKLQEIVSDNKLTKEDFNAMINSFTVEPDRNLFGVVNAITRTANDKDGEAAYQLQRIGTKLLADNTKG